MKKFKIVPIILLLVLLSISCNIPDVPDVVSNELCYAYPYSEDVWPVPANSCYFVRGFGCVEDFGVTVPLCCEPGQTPEKDNCSYSDFCCTRNRPYFHFGIDLGCPVGTPVINIMPGYVKKYGWYDESNPQAGYGLYAAIDTEYNPNTIITNIYGHLDSLSPECKINEFCDANIIGTSGNTGRSTGPHLHWETRINNVPVDPMSIFVGNDYKTTTSLLNSIVLITNISDNTRYYNHIISNTLPLTITVAEKNTFLGVFDVNGALIKIAPANGEAIVLMLPINTVYYFNVYPTSKIPPTYNDINNGYFHISANTIYILKGESGYYLSRTLPGDYDLTKNIQINKAFIDNFNPTSISQKTPTPTPTIISTPSLVKTMPDGYKFSAANIIEIVLVVVILLFSSNLRNLPLINSFAQKIKRFIIRSKNNELPE